MLLGCEQHTMSDSVSFAEEITRVDINLDSADVLVTGREDGQGLVDYDVRYRGSEPDLTAEVVDGTLRVRMDCHLSCDGDFIIRVPSSATAVIRLDSGDMTVEDLAGVTALQVDSGNIEVRNLSGNLTLSADSGNISGNVRSLDVEGDVDSGSLSLHFDETPDDVDLTADSGNVSVSVPEGAYDIRTHVDSGRVELRDVTVDNHAPSVISADVDSGNIKIVGY